MKITLILAALVLIFAVIDFILLRMLRSIKDEKKILEAEFKAEQIRTQNLNTYIIELKKLQKEKEATEKKISEAKTDEELMEIAGSIVDRNNSRVRKQTTKKNKSSTKTRKD